MRAEIKNEDIKMLENLAKKYDMSIVDFGKAIVSQTKKYNQRMFRVSESEYKEIAKKAERAGMNLMRYCEYSCAVFLKEKKIDENFFCKKKYGKDRVKRIAVSFRNQETESEFVEFAEQCNIEIGTLIRYCALMNDCEV